MKRNIGIKERCREKGKKDQSEGGWTASRINRERERDGEEERGR